MTINLASFEQLFTRFPEESRDLFARLELTTQVDNEVLLPIRIPQQPPSGISGSIISISVILLVDHHPQQRAADALNHIYQTKGALIRPYP